VHFLRYNLAIYPSYLRSLWRRGVDGQMGARDLSAHLRGVVHCCAGGAGSNVERLYCKRSILCLSSSKILTPDPPQRPAIVYPRLLCGERGGGGSIFWKTRDTALYSTYVSTLSKTTKLILLDSLLKEFISRTPSLK
jgi:hypothetical protein